MMMEDGWTTVHYRRGRRDRRPRQPYWGNGAGSGRGTDRVPPAFYGRQAPIPRPNLPVPPTDQNRYYRPQWRSYAGAVRGGYAPTLHPFTFIRGRDGEGNVRQQPADPVFGQLVRKLHGIIKMVHHLQNVAPKPGKTEPRMISKMVEILATTIKPASPTPATLQLIWGNAKNWGYNTLLLLESHYKEGLENLLQEVERTLTPDWRSAFEVATRWARRNLTRITQDVLDYAEALITSRAALENRGAAQDDTRLPPDDTAPRTQQAQQQTTSTQQAEQRTTVTQHTQDSHTPPRCTRDAQQQTISTQHTTATEHTQDRHTPPQRTRDAQQQTTPKRQTQQHTTATQQTQDSHTPPQHITDAWGQASTPRSEPSQSPILLPDLDSEASGTPQFSPGPSSLTLGQPSQAGSVTPRETSRPAHGWEISPSSAVWNSEGEDETPVLLPQQPEVVQSTPNQSGVSSRGKVALSSPRPQRVKVICHPKSTRKMIDWDLQVQKKWVILGDSNLARISGYPIQDLQIDSYPGANFRHAQALLSKATSQVMVEKLVLSFGINCRGQRAKETAIKQMQAAIRTARKTFPHAEIWIPVINYSFSLPAAEQVTLQTLNLHIMRHTPFIPALSSNVFRTEKDDIHWTKNTANAILDHWLSFLNWNAPQASGGRGIGP